MNYPVRRWRPILRVVAIALALAIPLPALAADGPQAPPAKPGLRASIGHAVSSARLTTAPGKAKETSQSQTTPDARAQLGRTSFFKTPAGIAVIAIVGAGAGYAVYSASQDRIHSVVRSTQ